MTIRVLLLILHIAAAALLFGSPLGIVRNAKSALDAHPSAFKLAAQEAARRGALAGIASLVTLLSGVALILLAGGFAVVQPRFHISLTLLLVAMIFSGVFMRPRTKKLVASSQQDPLPKQEVLGTLKQLAMGSGILHTVWLVILVLMVYHD
jgi:uncharacterized membrane protein